MTTADINDTVGFLCGFPYPPGISQRIVARDAENSGVLLILVTASQFLFVRFASPMSRHALRTKILGKIANILGATSQPEAAPFRIDTSRMGRDM